ncbi:hypothetical protein [Paramagnetospirillum caucaseum]|uniref:hypothetical protein n=1 Tax=Paramagnetospirillum caucaseum TaxID=1244869 RepID=UPI00126829DA|nr:hypothetical protein [Paramagnetospirillum caucaseum]
MTKNRSSFLLVMAVVLVLLATPLLWPVSPWLVRALALAILGLLTVVQWRKGNGLVLSSALFILPNLILVFYSIAGAVMVETLGGAAPIDDPMVYATEYARRAQATDILVVMNVVLAYGSAVELIVVQFALCLLAASTVIAGLPGVAANTPPLPRKTEILALLGMIAVVLATHRLIKGGDAPAGEVGKQLAFLLLPLAAFAIAQAARWWAAGLPGGALLLAGVTLVSWVEFIGDGIKPLALVLPSCLILVSCQRLRTLRQGLWLLMAVAILCMASVALIGFQRGNYGINNPVEGAFRSLRSKVALRQAETMFCLTSAANAASLASMEGRNPPDPGYLFGILVPRQIWPDKPDYSQGGAYAVDYCLFPPQDLARSHHSASITLLGEPLLHGGKPMLLVFGAVVVAGLAGLALAARRGPPALATSILAMTGWMVDFDQHSTLYLGNAVKVALCLIGPALLFHWLSARTARSSDPGPAPGS